VVVFFPLVIIRFVLVVLTFVLYVFPVAFIATLGADSTKPFSKWRRQTLLWIRPPLKVILFLMGVSVNVTGWDNYQDALENDLVRFFRCTTAISKINYSVTTAIDMARFKAIASQSYLLF
jgi:hypothetical protein